jgi:hypothetical protein
VLGWMGTVLCGRPAKLPWDGSMPRGVRRTPGRHGSGTWGAYTVCLCGYLFSGRGNEGRTSAQATFRYCSVKSKTA